MGSSKAQKLLRRGRRMVVVTLKALLPLLLLAVPALADEGILDCLTGPCVTVSGVGKLQGTWQSTQWTDRRVYGFLGIPFGETTGGEHRFGPPRPKGPLNDGRDAFDASYLNYITDWWDHVCPQAGISLGGEFVNPLLAQAAQCEGCHELFWGQRIVFTWLFTHQSFLLLRTTHAYLLWYTSMEAPSCWEVMSEQGLVSCLNVTWFLFPSNTGLDHLVSCASQTTRSLAMLVFLISCWRWNGSTTTLQTLVATRTE